MTIPTIRTESPRRKDDINLSIGIDIINKHLENITATLARDHETFISQIYDGNLGTHRRVHLQIDPLVSAIPSLIHKLDFVGELMEKNKLSQLTRSAAKWEVIKTIIQWGMIVVLVIGSWAYNTWREAERDIIVQSIIKQQSQANENKSN